MYIIVYLYSAQIGRISINTVVASILLTLLQLLRNVMNSSYDMYAREKVFMQADIITHYV